MIKLHTLLLFSALIFVHFAGALDVTGSVPQTEFEVFLPELYELYLYALHYDKISITRRLFKDSKFYMMHVEKLSDVNGIRKYQFTIGKGTSQSKHLLPWIYHLQSAMPHISLKQEEFVKALKIIQEEESGNKNILNHVHRVAAKSRYFNVFDVAHSFDNEERRDTQNGIIDNSIKDTQEIEESD